MEEDNFTVNVKVGLQKKRKLFVSSKTIRLNFQIDNRGEVNLRFIEAFSKYDSRHVRRMTSMKKLSHRRKLKKNYSHTNTTCIL